MRQFPGYNPIQAPRTYAAPQQQQFRPTQYNQGGFTRPQMPVAPQAVRQPGGYVAGNASALGGMPKMTMPTQPGSYNPGGYSYKAPPMGSVAPIASAVPIQGGIQPVTYGQRPQNPNVPLATQHPTGTMQEGIAQNGMPPKIYEVPMPPPQRTQPLLMQPHSTETMQDAINRTGMPPPIYSVPTPQPAQTRSPIELLGGQLPSTLNTDNGRRVPLLKDSPYANSGETIQDAINRTGAPMPIYSVPTPQTTVNSVKANTLQGVSPGVSTSNTTSQDYAALLQQQLAQNAIRAMTPAGTATARPVTYMPLGGRQ